MSPTIYYLRGRKSWRKRGVGGEHSSNIRMIAITLIGGQGVVMITILTESIPSGLIKLYESCIPAYFSALFGLLYLSFLSLAHCFCRALDVIACRYLGDKGRGSAFKERVKEGGEKILSTMSGLTHSLGQGLTHFKVVRILPSPLLWISSWCVVVFP